ncbi:hypothetical protein BaRGS_00009951 [Batillaria attramentaria]|uniref:Uncharacterized protein n=1 Tax=Batillaria attramentaria TaxID=370345 RepID=A0ABD0LH98_9CAEN
MRREEKSRQFHQRGTSSSGDLNPLSKPQHSSPHTLTPYRHHILPPLSVCLSPFTRASAAATTATRQHVCREAASEVDAVVTWSKDLALWVKMRASSVSFQPSEYFLSSGQFCKLVRLIS